MRDAGPRDPKGLQGPGRKIALGRARVARAAGAACELRMLFRRPPVLLGVRGPAMPLGSRSRNGPCALMRRRPAATSFTFQVSVSLRAGP